MPLRAPPETKARRRLSVVVAGLLGLGACVDSVVQVGNENVVEIRVTPDTAQVGVGRTFRMQGLALDETGAFLVGQGIVWSTGEPGVASIDDAGMLTGVSRGDTEVTATVGEVSTSAVVMVRTPPALELSRDSVELSATVGGLNPPPDSVLVTNGGELPLTRLTVDSVVYEAGAEGWLVGRFSSTAAPTALILEGRTTSITEPGEHVGTIWVSGAEADGSPASVVVLLTMDDGPPLIVPSAISVAAGDGQTQVSGFALPTAPTVTVIDQFGDPVQGAVVDFAASGSGSVGAASVVTNASGLAATSWIVDVGGSTLQDDGTYPNVLLATVQGTTLQVSLDASAIYSWEQHVNPELCVGCHSGSPPAAGLSLDGDAQADYAELILEPLTCDDDGAALPATYRRVSTAGGVQAADDFSMLLRYTDPALSGIGACDFSGHPEPLTAAQLEIIRAWIRNGAPNN